jgi:hypothetical protein
MTELIKSPAALPLLGFRNVKGREWRGVGIMGMQCGEGRRTEVTGSGSGCIICASAQHQHGLRILI